MGSRILLRVFPSGKSFGAPPHVSKHSPHPPALSGSHCVAFAGMHGVSFMVWAPRARAVSVVGDWSSERDKMGSALVGSLRTLCSLTEGLFGYQSVKICQFSVPFSPICQTNIPFAATPVVLTPFSPQPRNEWDGRASPMRQRFRHGRYAQSAY